MVLPFKSPSAAQVLPLTHLHRLSELVFRMLAFFFRIAPKQALTDGASFQEPKCCPSASVDPAASFVGIGFPNVGILFFESPQNKQSLMVLPFKSPSAAQVLQLTHLHRLSELVFRMLALFFQIAPKQAVADCPPFQEPKCCPSASVDPAASFVGIGFPNVGILLPDCPKTSPN